MIFSAQNATNLNSAKGKKKKKRCQLPGIHSSLTARVRLSNPHPSSLQPNSHQASDLTDSRPFEVLFWEETETYIYSHTPTQHLIRCRDLARQRCRSPVVLCSDRPVLACECVQGFRGQSSTAAAAPRCGLRLTCPTRRKAERIAPHMCTAQ